MEKILVGTGGSPWSQAAVSYAARLARQEDAQLIVVHVIDTGRPSFPVHERKQKEAEAILERARRTAAEFLDDVDARCMKGSVPDALMDTADREKCDLIVMGSRGKSGVKDRVLGSILEKVILKSRRPVTVVKRPADVEEILKVGQEKMVFPEAQDPHAHLESLSRNGEKADG